MGIGDEKKAYNSIGFRKVGELPNGDWRQRVEEHLVLFEAPSENYPMGIGDINLEDMDEEEKMTSENYPMGIGD